MRSFMFIFVTLLWIIGIYADSSKEIESDDCGCNKLNRNNLVTKSKITSDSEDSSTPTSNNDGKDTDDEFCRVQDQCEQVPSKLAEDSFNDVEESTVEVEEDGETISLDGESAKKTTNTYDKLTLSVLLSNPMLKISEGLFLMGTEQVFIPQDGESPIRRTQINAFYIDKKEVSNAEFARFVAATNYKTEVNTHLVFLLC